MVGVVCEHKRQVLGETKYEWSATIFKNHVPHVARTTRKCKDCGEELPEMISRAFDNTHDMYTLNTTERTEEYVRNKREEEG